MFDYVSSNDFIEINNTQIPVNNVTLSKSAYNPKTGKIIGTAMAKVLTFEMDNSEVVEGQSFTYHAVTVNSEGDGEDHIIGTFIAVDAAIGDTEGVTTVTAMDIMLLANKAYMTSLTYSSGTINIDNVLNEICVNTGITLSESTSLINGLFIVDKNHFTNGETYREVIAAIAEINGAFAQIVNDELVFITPDKNAVPIAEVIPEEYETLTVQEATDSIEKVTFINSITGESQTVGGEGAELVIQDNPFVNKKTGRDIVLNNIHSVVQGLTYYVYSAKGLGDPQLNCGDRIRVFDSSGKDYDSFMFSMDYRSTSGLKCKSSVTSAPAVPKAAVKYVYTPTSEMQSVKKAMNYVSTIQTDLDAAAKKLNSPGTSYVRFNDSVSDPHEIIIMDDLENPKNVLRLNSAGIGISNDGGTNYSVAALDDGLFAKIIKAGGITADDIKAGTISSAIMFTGVLQAALGSFSSLAAGATCEYIYKIYAYNRDTNQYDTYVDTVSYPCDQGSQFSSAGYLYVYDGYIPPAQRMEMGFDSNNEPFIRMYENNNTLVWTWDKTGITQGTKSKIATYTIGEKYGMGVFVS